MKKITRKLASLLMSVVLAASLILPSLAVNTPGKVDYVAFGDSVAAGVRGGVGTPGSEKSSDKGYTDDIAVMLKNTGVLGNFDESFCTSGMTAKGLKQSTAVLTDASSAAAKLVKDADMVTLDIGANDLLAPLYAYVGTLTSITSVDMNKAKELLTNLVNDVKAGTVPAEIQSNIEAILTNILTANGSVKIFVMGYYNPLPTVSSALGVDLNDSIESLNKYIQKAISNVQAKYPNASITYVPTFAAMAAAPASLVPTDIHPTESGYQVIAGEFWKKIQPMVAGMTAVALPAEAQAVPATSPIVVNGKTLPFDAYNINGSNYIKLRDVAMALNGTTKQVSVGYVSETSSIMVTSGQAYTPVGGELIVPAARTGATAHASSAAFYFNGTEMNLGAYNINGNNFLKLRDVAKAFNIAVTYDAATNTVTIDSSKDYTA